MPIGAAKIGLMRHAVSSAQEVGDLDLTNSINNNTIWAVSSHLSGSPLLGTELVNGGALTTFGGAGLTAAHPDNASQLGLDNPGTSSGAHASNAAILNNVTTAFTFWMDFTLDAFTAYQQAFGAQYDQEGVSPYARIGFGWWDTAGNLFVTADTAGPADNGRFNVTSFTIATGTRHRIAVTKNGNTITFYHNANSTSGTIANGTSNLITTGGNTSNPMCIGCDAVSGANSWDGKIHRAQIWSRALSGTEIGNLNTNPRLGTYT